VGPPLQFRAACRVCEKRPNPAGKVEKAVQAAATDKTSCYVGRAKCRPRNGYASFLGTSGL